MPIIDRPQNQHVKLFRSLEHSKARQESGLFAVEGVHAIEDMLGAGWKAMVGYWCPDLLPGEDLAEALLENSKEFVALSRRAFEAMSGVQAPQGIAAAVRIPKPTFKSIKAVDGVILVVHELRDPGNMGNMIRTADAGGALAVVAVDSCVDYWMPKVARAAAGSMFHLPLVETTTERLLEWSESSETPLVATVVAGGEPCSEISFPQRCAILIGSEAQGLPSALLTASQTMATIPMPGRAESLNATIAAGIMLYEYNRQRPRCQDTGVDGEE
ncbi:MAG: RNA methyltransferase [Armatimonadota bacterium]